MSSSPGPSSFLGEEDIPTGPSSFLEEEDTSMGPSSFFAEEETSFLGEEDTYLFRLRKMEAFVVRFSLRHILSWCTLMKDTSINFFDYLRDKNDDRKPIGKFKKLLKPKQKQFIESDLTGETYDTSLLYVCIKWMSDGLAPVNDEKWNSEDNSLEAMISAAKDFRNEYAHELPNLEKSEFMKRTEDLRKLMTNLLEEATKFFSVSSENCVKALAEINNRINYLRDSSLVPQNYDEYRKLPLFNELLKLMKTDGRIELAKLLNEWDIISPVSKMTDVTFKVDTVYTNIVLKFQKSKKPQSLLYENILKDCNDTTGDPVVLVEGIAGVGKSTLTKKILSEWVSGLSSMKNLNDFDLLFFTECRNSFISSFADLVKAMVTDVSKCFMGKELFYTVLSLRTLVIIDGLDELNTVSLKLVKELLHLKKFFGKLTLLVTTRPERVKTYYNLVVPSSIKTKHIQIEGVHDKMREEFVIKYHEEMEKKGICHGDIDGLLQYLRRTKSRLDQLWKLPFNLTLLCIMWNKDPDLVNTITTSPELYWQIHLQCINKLRERLQHTALCALSELELDNKIDYFIFRLSTEALIGLQHDEINLSYKAVENLISICTCKGLPPDEMISAFLKKNVMKTASGWTTRFTFTHKGFQDFLAAVYLWKILLGQNKSYDVDEIIKEIQKALDTKGVPTSLSQKIMLDAGNSLKGSIPLFSLDGATGSDSMDDTMIRNLLTNGDASQTVVKFQNVLQILIGLFCIDNKTIKDSNKLEVLKLLQESGINDRNQWLAVLNSVKSDEFVMKFVSNVPGIMEGTIEIEDGYVFAYASLFKIAVPSAVKLYITSNPKEIPRLKELLDLINDNEMKVKDLKITDINVQEFASRLIYARVEQVDIDLRANINSLTYLNGFLVNLSNSGSLVRNLHLHYFFRYPSSLLSVNNINDILTRCGVEHYTGSATVSTTFPTTLQKIWVSVASPAAYVNLLEAVIASKNLQELKLCIPACVEDPDDLIRPLPDRGMLPPSLYITDVRDEASIDAAINIAHKLLPDSERRSFYRVSFPRAAMNFDLQKRLILGLKGVDVWSSGGICFPSSCSLLEHQQKMLKEDAKQLVKSDLCWESSENVWW